VGARGAYRLGKPADEIGVPASVQSVLAARIDRLPEREKQVLQTASVIGKTFSEPILRRVVDLGDGDLPGVLQALTNAEFLYQEALYPEAEFAFKHPLTQEVAYRSQLADRRARVHGRVARAIEELEAEKLGERAALLAYHWENAGEAQEAAKCHRRAAEWVGLNNSTEALRHWQSVRGLLAKLPDTPANLAEGALACAQMMTHLARLGDLEDQATSLFQEGRELATRSGDPHVLSQVLNSFGLLKGVSGAVGEALDQLVQSVQRADETADVALKAANRYGLCIANWQAARLRECLAVADQGQKLAQGDLTLGADRSGLSPSLGFSLFRSVLLSQMGRLREGAVGLDRVIRLAQASQQLNPLWLANIYHVFRCDITGEAPSALAYARAAMEYAERMGSESGRIAAYYSLGIAHCLNCAWDDALEGLEQALATEGNDGC
jgi:adenylate cyclase